MGETVYLNGAFVPIEKALVPVEDRGYQFADGIYEVIRVYGGGPFRLEHHLDRLERSAAAIELSLPPRMEIEAAAYELLRRNNLAEAGIYLQVTRGVAPRQHLIPEGIAPTVVMTARAVSAPKAETWQRGVAAVTVPDGRWELCHVKSVGLLFNTLAKQQAHRAGAFEAIFVRDGVVTEGSSSNLFALIDGVLFTHPRDNHILAGITRGAVIELAKKLGRPLREEKYTKEDLDRAQEVFFSSSIVEIVPVVSIDGRPVGRGVPGPVTLGIREAFEALTKKE